MALIHAILLFATLSICLVPSLGDIEVRILLQLWKATESYIKGYIKVYPYFSVVVYAATVSSLVSGLCVVWKANHGKIQARVQLHEILYPMTDLACGICNECRQFDYCCRHPLPGK